MTATTNAPVLTKNEKILALQSFLEKRTENIRQIASSRVTPDRLIKVVVTAASRTPQLLECTPVSIYLALMQAADLGLEPNTPLQLAALVPFKNKKQGGATEAQFQPMYKGLIKLALQSGDVVSIMPRVVYEKDTFFIQYGTDEKIDHTPYMKGNPGASTGFYAVATMKDGTKVFWFLSRADAEAVKKRSQSGDDGPWVTDFDAMAMKTAIKRLTKYLSLSSEKFGRAVAHDDKAEAGEGPDYSDVIDVSGEVLPEKPTPALDNQQQANDLLKTADRAKATVAEKAKNLTEKGA